jgi:hypothetical protein
MHHDYFVQGSMRILRLFQTKCVSLHYKSMVGQVAYDKQTDCWVLAFMNLRYEED